MRYIKLLVLGFLILFSCKSPEKITSNNSAKENVNMSSSEYYKVSSTDKTASLLDKKVVFKGKISKMPAQHMMRSTPPGQEPEEHKYIDAAEDLMLGQMVAYYLPSKVKWPVQAENLLIYGTIQSMSGAGKGGGTHTEYYLLVDKVESFK
jgi:hypothetical protein